MMTEATRYRPDTPIATMLADVRDRLVAKGAAHGVDFDPARDCGGYQWWVRQRPETVGAFVDHLAAAARAGEADQGWLYALIALLPDRLYPAARETLILALTGDRATMVALSVKDLTPAEQRHLKPICIARYVEQPRLRTVVAGMLPDA